MEDTKEPYQCESSIKDHVKQVSLGLAVVETDTRCYGVYKALMDVAEYIRVERNWPKVEATGEFMREAVNEALTKMKELEAKEALAEQTKPMVALTEAERKKMN